MPGYRSDDTDFPFSMDSVCRKISGLQSQAYRKQDAVCLSDTDGFEQQCLSMGFISE